MADNAAIQEEKKIITAESITVKNEIQVPKNPRNKVYQVVKYLNEKGEVILENRNALSASRWSELVRTNAGKKITPNIEDDYYSFPL